MKHTLLLLFTCGLLNITNAQTLEFTYDSAGNQIQRELVMLSVTSFSNTTQEEDIPEEQDMESSDFNQANVEYFPNPVEGLLNVRWDSSILITKIYLFSSGGQLLQIQET